MGFDFFEGVKTGARSVTARDRNRPIEQDDRCRLEFVEIVVELDKLRPICIGVARSRSVYCGNLRLKMISGDRIACGGGSEMTHAENDEFSIPQFAILFREYGECSVRECAGRQTSGLQHHQREQGMRSGQL